MSDAQQAPGPLTGVGVLITRPAHQAGKLAQLIEQAGGTAIRFPTIEIAPPLDPEPLLALLDRLGQFDLAIFVSPNAVEHTFGWLRARRLAWPERLPAACVGAGSAAALQRHGVTAAAAPDQRFDSEALLALPELRHMAGKRVVIFRGDGGRALLGDALTQRGAAVTYAECYRRLRPPADPAELIERWRRAEIHIVSITSTAGLRNLYDMLGEAGRGWLVHTPIVVLSEAQAATCRRLGVTAQPLLAAAASDEAILEAIRTWRRGRFSL